MASQQASSQFLKNTTEGELMTKGDNDSHRESSFSTSQMKRAMTQLQFVTTKVRTRRMSEEYIMREVISAVENSIGEN